MLFVRESIGVDDFCALHRLFPAARLWNLIAVQWAQLPGIAIALGRDNRKLSGLRCRV